jgi:hypothetical protein
MARVEGRIVLAAIAVFVTLGGLTASIRGLLYERPTLVELGVCAMVIGIAGFVWFLRPGNRAGK